MPHPFPNFTPFADESAALMVGDLNFENRVDRVSLYGSLDITRDQAGLSVALELKAHVDRIVDALQSQQLPEAIRTEAPGETRNPFQP